MQIESINVCGVCKMFSVLVQHDVLSQIVQILKLASSVSNTTITSLDIR